MATSAESLVEVQRAAPSAAPSDVELIAAAEAAMHQVTRSGTVSLCLIDDATMADMNARYRDKDGSTNVLSFAQDVRDECGRRVLGDVLLCPIVIEREAHEQGKSTSEHYQHMVVHGVLHLLGFDHEDVSDAQVMEDHERAILATLNIADPYVARSTEFEPITERRTAPDG